MPEKNLERMIKLAEEFFGAKKDPTQITVTPADINKLKGIHSATMTEKRDRNGPIAWVIVIPTTHDLMEKFITKRITEQKLLEETPLQVTYEAVYLCSALVLPEYRGKGLARSLASKAIKSILKQHPIQGLFYWTFSVAGEGLANRIATEFNLPLHKRSD
jgi:GNAT superfamily N-acetyltransferase